MDYTKESYICIKSYQNSLTVGREYFVTDYNLINRKPYTTGDDGRRVYINEEYFKEGK